MEFRIADFRLLIAELRKSAVNNRKSSFKDDRNRDWLSSGNVEELKDAPQLQTHPTKGLITENASTGCDTKCVIKSSHLSGLMH